VNSEEFHNLYFLPNTFKEPKSRRIIWAINEGDEKYMENFCRKSWRKETTWRTRPKWKNNIKRDRKELSER
jgi:hypothetical protein